ncbi:aminodeoxychorismate synthase component I [Dehalobacterium formicoaceticum]|uniref:aminodeoxychorismate synthase component I n=1 Tax=Dehalobacterium formicoaceticum TaxID=51515 RepID=UPI000B7EC616|nr:aminodeoxychorismate synthase component I [Dehalobacterium formicoaceticum]
MKTVIKELASYQPCSRIFDLFCRDKNAVFLDSSLENEMGRYSIIGINEYLTLILKDGRFFINGVESEENFEEYLNEYILKEKEENHTTLPIVKGGIGYFSYDYGRKIEKIATRHEHKDHDQIPECIWNFYDNFIIEDLKEKKVYLIANGELEDAEMSIKGLEEKINLLSFGTYNTKIVDDPGGINKPGDLNYLNDLNDLNEINNLNDTKDFKKTETFSIQPNFTKDQYLSAVQKMIDYIVEGDIYIANMTQNFKVRSRLTPYQFFLKLRISNPSTFGGYFNYGDFQIISASPERFMVMKEGVIHTRPIKGTRKRGQTPWEDEQLKKELQNSDKDKSELLMIVDLERNDLNKVCVERSVVVNELFQVESYATVHHLVSDISGVLRPGYTVVDLIKAAFPGGSITGAPKHRAMEIIDELEHGQRGLYTGSMGYISLDGSFDFNIVIRTAVYIDGFYHIGAGGGITCESELEFEYDETLQKAKALFEALSEF